MSQDILSQLKELKSHPEAGGVSRDLHAQLKTRISEAVAENHDAQAEYSVADGVLYYRFLFRDFISKPVMAGAAAFILLIGGWFTSVNAASESLPGDSLYGVKIVAEQLQLRLSTADRKAILHTEFAQHRYQEAIALETVEGGGAHVEKTLEAFRTEIGLAQSELENLKDTEASTEVAIAVDEKLDELNAVIGSTSDPQTNVEETEQVADALVVTGAIEETVYNTVARRAESEAGGISKIELDRLFKGSSDALLAREASNLGRVHVIEAALATNEPLADFVLPGASTLSDLGGRITETLTRLDAARGFISARGIDSAFATLQEIDESLTAIEAELATIEIAIVNAMQVSQEVIDEPEETLEDL